MVAPAYVNGHSLTINGKNKEITRADLERVALQNDIHDYNSTIDKVTHAIAQFESHAIALDIDRRLIKKIESTFRFL